MRTFRKLLRIGFLLALGIGAAAGVGAQVVDTSVPGSKPKTEDLPQNIQESLAERRIAQEKKDHEELLKRGEEALKLSADLEKSFSENNRFSSDDRKKLDRLEKLVKRIRSDLGGDDVDPDAEEQTPSTVPGAVKFIQENTIKLVDELKKTTRYTISAIAIQSSNLLLKAVKIIRFGQ
jgi:hypothetical protein